MRGRRWILVLAVGAAFVISGIYVGWRASEANERIRRLLVARIREVMSDKATIENLEVGWGRVRLRGILLAAPDDSYSLTIEQAEIGYSLWSLLRSRFSPSRVPNQAVFVRPVLTLRSNGNLVSRAPPDSLKEKLQSYSTLFLNIRRVTLVDGRLMAQGSQGRIIQLAHGLYGWVQNRGSEESFVRLSGNVFESPRKNLTLEARLNVPSGRVTLVEARVRDSKPPPQLPLLLPGSIQALEGTLEGNFSYQSGGEAKGNLSLKEGTLSMAGGGLLFTGVDVEGNLEGRDIVIKTDVRGFNGSPFTIRGKIHNIFNPEADLVCTFTRFDLPAFFRHLFPDKKVPFTGQLKASLLMKGPLENPKIEGKIQSNNAGFSLLVFDHFSADLSFKDDVAELSGEGSGKGGLRAQLHYLVGFKDSLVIREARTRIQGDAAPSFRRLLPAKVTGAKTRLVSDLQGGINSIRGYLQGRVAFGFAGADSLIFKPRLEYVSEELRASVFLNEAAILTGEVHKPLKSGSSFRFSFNKVEDILMPLAGEFSSDPLKSLDLAAVISGTYQDWTLTGTALQYSPTGTKKAGDVELQVQASEPGTWEWQGGGTYFGEESRELTWELAGKDDEKGARIQSGRVRDMIQFSGSYPLWGTEKPAGTLRISGFYLQDLHNIFPGLRFCTGKVAGRMDWSDNSGKERFTTQLHLRDLSLYGSRLMGVDLDYEASGRGFETASLQITGDSRPLLSGQVGRRDSLELAGHFEGDSLSINQLMRALGSTVPLTGEAAIRIDVTGTVSSPLLSLSMQVDKGQIGPVQFHSFSLAATDSTKPGGLWPQGVLVVNRAHLYTDQGCEVEARGRLDHGWGGGSSMYIQGRGELLAHLPAVSPLFVRGRGSGEISLRMARASDRWVIGDGSVSLENGVLELNEIARTIENISVRAELKAGDRLLDLQKVSGKIGKGTVSLSNQFPEGYPKGVEPLFLNSFSLNLGVIKLETSDPGILLHLPALMEGGDTGYFSFSGLDKGKMFIIAGPASNPLVQGRISLTSTRLTYPFLARKKDNEKGSGLEFTNKVQWDLFIIPHKDVSYVRRLEFPLGNVYVDLLLSDGTGGIRLAGIPEEGDLTVWGNLVSTEGTIEAADHLFRPERITFDYPKGSSDPFLRGRAYTTIIDSLGAPAIIWMEITSRDDDTGLEKTGGPWKRVWFRFTTDNPNLSRSEADLMAALGYSTSQLKERAYTALGLQVENLIFRPLFRPIERGLRKHLGLDVVRFSSQFSRNLVQWRSTGTMAWDPKLLFQSSRITVGKYLANGLSLTYSGLIESNVPYRYHTQGIGFRHALILEYTIRPDLFLEIEYNYDSQLLAERREDKRIWLRHVFPF